MEHSLSLCLSDNTVLVTGSYRSTTGKSLERQKTTETLEAENPACVF